MNVFRAFIVIWCYPRLWNRVVFTTWARWVVNHNMFETLILWFKIDHCNLWVIDIHMTLDAWWRHRLHIWILIRLFNFFFSLDVGFYFTTFNFGSFLHVGELLKINFLGHSSWVFMLILSIVNLTRRLSVDYGITQKFRIGHDVVRRFFGFYMLYIGLKLTAHL